MATIATLNAILSLNSQGFERGTRRAIQQTTMLQASVSKAASAVKSFGATLGISFLASRLFRSLDSLGNIGELSDQLGITTKQLMGLHFAAGQVGLEAGELDQSIGMMLKNLGKAATDGGEAAEAVGRLGISLDSVIRENPGEAFLQVVEALSNIPNAAVRARFATAIFGRESVKLNRFAAMGREGIESLMKMADRMGITFDRSAADAADRATDAFTSMKSAANALLGTIGVGLSPAIETFFGVANRQISDLIHGLRQLPSALALLNSKKNELAEDALGLNKHQKMLFDLTGLKEFGPPLDVVKTFNEILSPAQAEQRGMGYRELVGFQGWLFEQWNRQSRSSFDVPFMTATEGTSAPDNSLDRLLNNTNNKIGGGLRTAKELGFAPTPTGGGASTIPGKQLTVLENVLRVLQRIEKKPGGVVA